MKALADSSGKPYPRVLIVGDANQGGEPQKNQVAVHYFYDPTGGCYFDPDPTRCPTDDEALDFDYDDLADMQVARLPLTHRWKVARAVANFLNKVNREPTWRALFTIGDVTRDGVSPDSLPEVMQDLIHMFQANGYQTSYMRDSDYAYSDFRSRQLAMADSLNLGVDIVVNMGAISNRSKIGGYFIQKVYYPEWNMGWLSSIGPRPFVFFGPGCDMADFDRDNPWYDPILAEMFLCNEETKPAAVAWISHGRGQWSSWHRIFAQEFVCWLFSGHARDLLDCYWLAKWGCWQKYPGMRDYLRSLFYLGWPVSIPGTFSSSIQAEKHHERIDLMVRPNPVVGSAIVNLVLPVGGKVSLKIYDVRGREILAIVDGYLESGHHSFIWTVRDSDGKKVAAGIYFVRLNIGGESKSDKVVILR